MSRCCVHNNAATARPPNGFGTAFVRPNITAEPANQAAIFATLEDGAVRHC
jgi:hypothetical protein